MNEADQLINTSIYHNIYLSMAHLIRVLIIIIQSIAYLLHQSIPWWHSHSVNHSVNQLPI